MLSCKLWLTARVLTDSAYMLSIVNLIARSWRNRSGLCGNRWQNWNTCPNPKWTWRVLYVVWDSPFLLFDSSLSWWRIQNGSLASDGHQVCRKDSAVGDSSDVRIWKTSDGTQGWSLFAIRSCYLRHSCSRQSGCSVRSGRSRRSSA